MPQMEMSGWSRGDSPTIAIGNRSRICLKIPTSKLDCNHGLKFLLIFISPRCETVQGRIPNSLEPASQRAPGLWNGYRARPRCCCREYALFINFLYQIIPNFMLTENQKDRNLATKTQNLIRQWMPTACNLLFCACSRNAVLGRPSGGCLIEVIGYQ